MIKFKKGGHLYVRTKLVTIRQQVTRNEGKYMLGGRERKKTRPEPSLPKLKCLE